MRKIELAPLCVPASEVKAMLRISDTHLDRLVKRGVLKKAKGLPNRYVWTSVLAVVGDSQLK